MIFRRVVFRVNPDDATEAKMTSKFTKENLTAHRGWVEYRDPEGKTHFVARFKYMAKSSTGPFMTHLRRNWTPEAYFAEMAAGKAPLEIVTTTGFVLSHIKRWLKDAGYPQTPEGYRRWTEAENAKINARLNA